MNFDEKEKMKEELFNNSENGIGSSVARVVLAGLTGIPIVGSVIGASGVTWSEYEQRRYQSLLKSWLLLQEEELTSIGQTLAEVMIRLDEKNEKVKERIESSEYLSLVKKCLREWSATDSEQKRLLVRNLLVNAAAENQLCSDDILALFVRWIDNYSETHFKVIREIHHNPGITRYEMWMNIHGEQVRDDSAEADLFKLIIHELTTGYIIRQYRETDAYGNFLKQKVNRSAGLGSNTMKSAFDNDKEYHLTELGRWFVHYTMNEVVLKIDTHSAVTQEE